MQDGSETGHTIEGNLGILTRESYTLTHSDTTPATFLLSNPNNTVRFNRAAGSAGTGFWLRFYDNVDGESVQVLLVRLLAMCMRLHACTHALPVAVILVSMCVSLCMAYISAMCTTYPSCSLIACHLNAAGPSFGALPTAVQTVCPKFMPLGEFRGNAAHSNLLYGFRIHPGYLVSDDVLGTGIGIPPQGKTTLVAFPSTSAACSNATDAVHISQPAQQRYYLHS